MLTKHCVAAAISATPAVLKPLVEDIQQTVMPIDKDFRLKFRYIEIDSDFALFVYYQLDGDWFDEWQAAWNRLEDLARLEQLAFCFQRLGSDFNDVDYRLKLGNYQDSRFLTLFEFNRKIVPMPLLECFLNQSYIAAVIAGVPEKLSDWMKKIYKANPPGLTSFLRQFQLVKISSDFAALVFYHQNLNWYCEIDERWEALKDAARKDGLTYYLRRFGHLFRDVQGHNSEPSHCDSRLFQLFEIDRDIVPGKLLQSLLQ